MSQNQSITYAAAEGREFLRGALEGKNNRYILEHAGLVDDPDVLRFLNYYCMVYHQRGDNFLDTPVGREVLIRAATNMTDRAYREGNVSQLKGAVGLTSSNGDAGDALAEIARRLGQEGTIAFIVGPPGSGKTALMVDISRAWGARTGGHIFSNLRWSGADGFIDTDEGMFHEMAQVKGPTLAALDELSQELTARGANQQKAEKFGGALTLVRKQQDAHGRHAKRGSILGVAHTKKRLAPILRRMATLIIQKPSRADPGKVRLYESEGGDDELEEIGEFTGLTDTRESYEQHEASEFDVLDESSDDDGDDGPSPEDIVRRERVRSYLLDCKPWDDDGGISQVDAAQKAGYGSTWATDRKKEWKRGEWNHLEDVPEPGEG